MESDVFAKFRTIVYERSGIALRPGKESLVSARVAKRMRALGIDTHRAYLSRLSEDQGGEELVHLIDAISTNVTSFFREEAHFDILGQLMTRWLDAGQRRFRFWSAACSSGEEPYTMAIALLEAAGGRIGNARILATDISTRILKRSVEGVYSADKVEPAMSSVLRERYFEKRTTEKGASYAVRPLLREMIVFRRLNLSKTPFPMRGPLDAVFCRNVMIYFDHEVRGRLMNEAYRLLKPGGYLFVGHAESLTGLTTSFKAVSPAAYVKPS